MFYLRDKGFVFFVASPYIRAWEDLEKRTMKLADLPMWDATRDFLLSDMAFRYDKQVKSASIFFVLSIKQKA